MSIFLKKNGIARKVATGYSFKSLLFGCLYCIARGDYRGALMQFGLSIATFGMSWIVVPFTYNKRFILRLIESGYKPLDDKAKRYLERKLDYSK